MLMGNETVLEVEKVSKIYARSRTVTRRRLGKTLSKVLFGRSYDASSASLQSGEFHAVKDVTFSLRRGEALGIIGLNGSGKTTLLRMLAGQILPDSGQIMIAGRTASMIDLTAGFQPAASGRENIFLRGAALGRSRAQMKAVFDEIVEFSELGDAIEAPVATYSSGMTMRLAFSIVSASSQDLLFIDEVLAVGDFRFRQKCLARIRALRDDSAFVMVSHNMTDIMRFCDRTIVLSKGNVVFEGISAEAVEFFESEIEQKTESVTERSLARVVGQFFENNDIISDVVSFWSDANGNQISSIKQGGELYFNASFKCSVKAKNLIIGIPVWSQDGIYITGFSTERGLGGIKTDELGRAAIRLHVPNLVFNAGSYHSNFVIVDGSEFLWRKPNDVLTVTVGSTPYWGMVTLPATWSNVVVQPKSDVM
ncbi:ABC transporter ATP-binding protein [Mesorhizobium sp. DCY119]|uniref:ABC transporter ATP-binding protein n=1 Tax=Mesorhizobium sp. DCY119 TaxID=2108445 RepID=UPI000E76D77D|nr:ABC transporter ATP-binding protein [Mesorhizobium sp. DCY119]RJG40882.1 ABC transporter ATP-binding protein [Mesorhizobium sp. DCY119]